MRAIACVAVLGCCSAAAGAEYRYGRAAECVLYLKDGLPVTRGVLRDRALVRIGALRMRKAVRGLALQVDALLATVTLRFDRRTRTWDIHDVDSLWLVYGKFVEMADFIAEASGPAFDDGAARAVEKAFWGAVLREIDPEAHLFDADEWMQLASKATTLGRLAASGCRANTDVSHCRLERGSGTYLTVFGLRDGSALVMPAGENPPIYGKEPKAVKQGASDGLE